MLNDVKLFSSKEFGTVRTVLVEGKVWFVGKDVAECLGYSNPQKAIRDHCKGVNETLLPTNGGVQTVNIINEYDVIRLIMKSRLPEAEKFEKWVIEEVIPSVLRTGSYTLQQPTKLQMTLGMVLNPKATDQQKAEALIELKGIFNQEGKAQLCRDSLITIQQIINEVQTRFPERCNYTSQICSTEWSRFLANLGYLRAQTFPRKEPNKGFELQPSYQPTDKFEELVELGMATARLIEDGRGKYEIQYTREILKLLDNEEFVELLFEHLDSVYSKTENK